MGRLDPLTFGHIADGNLHLLVTTGSASDLQAIYDTVYRATEPYGGTITAEHGVGVNKKQWLALSRKPQEIALMKTLKTALDPLGLLNPDRIF